MTTTEAHRLVRLIKGSAKKGKHKGKSSSMKILIDAKIYDRQGKLTKHFR